MFGRDLTSARSQPEERVIAPHNVGRLQPAWVMPAGGSIESGAIVVGGCAYIATQNGWVHAVNADTGARVWEVKLGSATTLSSADGRIFAQDGTAVVGLDSLTGEQLWRTDLNFDESPHAGGGSPLAFEDYVVAGISCTDDTVASAAFPRGSCRGRYAILDGSTGAILADGYDATDEEFASGMGGAGFWSMPSYDAESRHVYLGTANARTYEPENPKTSALLKIDADPSRDTFGEIVGAFRTTPLGQNLGNTVPGDLACQVTYGFQFCTGDDDYIQPAIVYRDSFGRKLLGIGHSHSRLPTSQDWLVNGVYNAIEPDSLQEIWRAQTEGGRSAAAAYDGTRFYVARGGQAFGGWGGLGGITALNKDTGAEIWTAPTFGDNNWRHIAHANGVIFTQSGGGVFTNPGLLLAYDALTGAILLTRPMAPDIGGVATAHANGGVTIARNTVYVPTNTAGGNAFLVAYRLS